MRPPFRERLLMAGIHWAEYRHRYPKAMARLETLEARRPLKTREQAFKAYLLLRTTKPDEARELFTSVRDMVKDRSDPESRYLTHYVQYWIAIIRWEPFNAREQSRKARTIECDPRLKNDLWVGDMDVEDPLDAEFDAWVRANPPGEKDLRKRIPGRPRA